jgi:hypothetical protein
MDARSGNSLVVRYRLIQDLEELAGVRVVTYCRRHLRAGAATADMALRMPRSQWDERPRELLIAVLIFLAMREAEDPAYRVSGPRTERAERDERPAIPRHSLAPALAAIAAVPIMLALAALSAWLL